MPFTFCISALLHIKDFYVSASLAGFGKSLILCKFMMQFINVYAPKYETAGKFWPIVHNLVIFSLVLMHVIAVGIFSLKKLPLASTLILPLPVLTLLFNEYCRKRFLPVLKLILLRYVDIPILLLHAMTKGISILMLSSFHPLSATLSQSVLMISSASNVQPKF